jgi:SAM-dependent methyltransferase
MIRRAIFGNDDDSIFQSLEKTIHDTYDPESELGDWNLNYFNGHTSRYRKMLRLVEDTHSGGRLLEIGSVPCHITYLLDQLEYDVTGLDINPDRVIEFVNRTGLEVIQSDIERQRFPFSDDTFQYILFSEVFEHLRINPINAIKEIHRVLEPGGTLLMTTPNLYALRHWVSFAQGRGLYASPYLEFKKVDELGHMGHVRVYSSNEVTEFLEGCGLRVRNIEYTNFHMGDRYGLYLPFALALYRISPSLRRFLVITATK